MQDKIWQYIILCHQNFRLKNTYSLFVSTENWDLSKNHLMAWLPKLISLLFQRSKMSQEFFFLGRKGEVRTILSSPLNKENKTKTTTQQKIPQTTSFFPQESNLHVFPSQESPLQCGSTLREITKMKTHCWKGLIKTLLVL